MSTWTGGFSDCPQCGRIIAIHKTEIGEHITCNHCNVVAHIGSQPAPQPGREVVLFHVINDLKRRAEKGKAQYGTYLETHNGRDGLLDLYEELLDAAMYTKQLMMERNSG